MVIEKKQNMNGNRRKRITSLIMVLGLLTGMFTFISNGSSVQAKNKFEGYTAISSPEDLADIVNDTTGKYYLTKDIDMAPYGLWDTIQQFQGVLDGNGHKVKNLSTAEDNGLFFFILGGATVKNLAIVNASINEPDGRPIGLLCASLMGESVVENCYVDGTISLNTRNAFNGDWINESNTGEYNSVIGGLVGCCDKGSSIKRCIGAVNITVDINNEASAGNTTKHKYNEQVITTINNDIGGIAGVNKGDIAECIYSGTISSNGNNSMRYRSTNGITAEAYLYVNCGGICGQISDDAVITDCQFTGSIQNTGSVKTICESSINESYYSEGTRCDIGLYSGGICGLAGTSKILYCYSSGNVSSYNGSGMIVGKTEKQFYSYGCVYLRDDKNNINKDINWIGTGVKNGSTAKKLNLSGVKKKKYYVNWDFKNVWHIAKGINSGCPMLRNLSLINIYQLDTVSSSVKAGTYKKAQTVELKAAEGATIYYTLDGSKPSKKSIIYDGTINIDKSTKIRAIAVLKGYKTSKGITYNYVIK